MERLISTERTGILIPKRRVIRKITPKIEITMPGRGSAVPILIGKLIEPVIEIINHPNRNRLMAELFKDYK